MSNDKWIVVWKIASFYKKFTNWNDNLVVIGIRILLHFHLSVFFFLKKSVINDFTQKKKKKGNAWCRSLKQNFKNIFIFNFTFKNKKHKKKKIITPKILTFHFSTENYPTFYFCKIRPWYFNYLYISTLADLKRHNYS